MGSEEDVRLFWFIAYASGVFFMWSMFELLGRIRRWMDAKSWRSSGWHSTTQRWKLCVSAAIITYLMLWIGFLRLLGYLY